MERQIQMNTKAISSVLYFIRNLVPDSIYYAKLFIPFRILYGILIKNKKRELLRFDAHVAGHCNVNCKGCEHFSPLTPASFIEAEKYESDCKRISELSGGKIADIALLGGEPLLNPRIIDIMRISRSYFPDGIIKIITNGKLLKNQTDEFWERCRLNNIIIAISVYPVNIDYAFIIDKAAKHGVQIQFRGDVRIVSKDWRKLPIDYYSENWRKMPIDVNGGQNPQKSNALCYASNFCFQLAEGRLYKCWRIAYIKYFNDYFNADLKVSEGDYIDIYQAKSIDEILDKLRKPAPFCRYCKLDCTPVVKWAYSKKEISEWIAP
jgi:sulfatase maturation enzyme AslB (radical SAM superfamily)